MDIGMRNNLCLRLNRGFDLKVLQHYLDWYTTDEDWKVGRSKCVSNNNNKDNNIRLSANSDHFCDEELRLW